MLVFAKLRKQSFLDPARRISMFRGLVKEGKKKGPTDKERAAALVT